MGQGSRRRRRRRGGRRTQQEAAPPPRRRSIKATIDSFGGFLTIGAVVLAVIVIAAFIWFNLPGGGASDDPLLGEAIETGPAVHVATVGEMEIVPGRPPVGGPHLQVWLNSGVFSAPVSDGNAVHSLEHGMVWISYNPDLVSDTDLEGLRELAEDFDNDVVLSPRPDNAMAIAAVSWGRLLELDALDDELLRDFVTTNRNRSPEPGARGRGISP